MKQNILLLGFCFIMLFSFMFSCDCMCGNDKKEQIDTLYTPIEEFHQLSFGDTIRFRSILDKNTIVIFQGTDNDSIYYKYDTGVYQGEGKMPYYIFTNK